MNTLKGGDYTSIISAGLPDIVGNTGFLRHSQPASSANSETNGAFALISAQNVLNNYDAGSTDAIAKYNFTASKSNAIYGSSDTVQPPAINLIPQIKY